MSVTDREDCCQLGIVLSGCRNWHSAPRMIVQSAADGVNEVFDGRLTRLRLDPLLQHGPVGRVQRRDALDRMALGRGVNDGLIYLAVQGFKLFGGK